MTRLDGRSGVLRLLLTPLVVIAVEVAVFGYLDSTHVSSPIRRVIEGNLLRSSVLREKLVTHVELVLLAFAITVAIGVPLSVLLFRGPAAVCTVVLAVASLGQVIPSVALLVIFATGIGIGTTPAVLALVAYALLPLLRNAVVGLRGVEAAAVDAARGMGMTEWQLLRHVQLPLAAPVVMAGLRTSLVLVVGTATLGNFIGAGGLGDVIGEGITAAVIGPRVVLAGAALAAGLALLADWVMGVLSLIVVPRTAPRRAF